ncbi:ABC transporter permease [Roseburia sp. AM59-24XD]|jgi:ABC-type antimicrobial peptide transport system permease subunit|uniref:ABC transporter permease n=1 Tax=Roseburia sp. AM59-24XD TaxID=2293138 RepID=UPI000E4733A0|nr:ABC transporter permease [Roseburia sp. AM59-24XD]RHP85130.1 ABC transporter permease [Roseburia sp. AM59-24XD]
MSFYDLMTMSMGNLWRRKLRTVLTVLGVLIGTTSIVAMLSLAFGMKQMIMDEYASMGSVTQIMISGGGGGDMDSSSSQTDTSTMLTETNMQMFQDMEHVKNVLPQLSFDGNMQSGRYSGYGNLIGVDQSILDSQELEKGDIPQKGSAGTLQVIAGNQILTGFGYVQGDEYVDYYSTGELPNIDLMTQIRVLQVYNEQAETDVDMQTDNGDSTGDDSSDGGNTDSTGDDAVAQPVEDNSMLNFRIKVAGILAGGVDEYNTYSNSLLVNIDDLKSYLTKNFGKGNIPGQPKPNGKPMNEWVYSTLVVDVDDASNVDSVMKDIQDMGFSASSNKDLLDSAQKNLQIVELVLGGIGMVAFLVAAIGIANTMMMSTYERTKEIGVMKVLGCDMRDIQKLFLAEAGFIGLIGGIVGLGLTCGVSALINHFAVSMGGMKGNISVIPWWLALAAVAFSTLMGMVAGYFPARRAMKLSPLAAIHTE